jgi:hypothetical protein
MRGAAGRRLREKLRSPCHPFRALPHRTMATCDRTSVSGAGVTFNAAVPVVVTTERRAVPNRHREDFVDRCRGPARSVVREKARKSQRGCSLGIAPRRQALPRGADLPASCRIEQALRAICCRSLLLPMTIVIA